MISTIGNSPDNDFESDGADYVLEKPMKLNAMDKLIEYMQMHGVDSDWSEEHHPHHYHETAKVSKVRDFFLS
jgi:hypothetical protein